MIAKLSIFFNSEKKSPLLALLNSKRLEISPKNGWRARVAGEPMTSFPNWRRVQDSNLRGLSPAGFQNQCHKPLGQPSTGLLYLIFSALSIICYNAGYEQKFISYCDC